MDRFSIISRENIRSVWSKYVTKRIPGPCAYKKLVYPSAERIVISITLGRKVIVLKRIKLSRRAEYNKIIKFEKIIVD